MNTNNSPPQAELGLEMVDILTNGVRRALKGNLQQAGWIQIRELVVSDKRRPHNIGMLSLQDDSTPNRKFPYWDVLQTFGKGGRNMLAPRFRGKQA